MARKFGERLAEYRAAAAEREAARRRKAQEVSALRARARRAEALAASAERRVRQLRASLAKARVALRRERRSSYSERVLGRPATTLPGIVARYQRLEAEAAQLREQAQTVLLSRRRGRIPQNP